MLKYRSTTIVKGCWPALWAVLLIIFSGCKTNYLKDTLIERNWINPTPAIYLTYATNYQIYIDTIVICSKEPSFGELKYLIGESRAPFAKKYIIPAEQLDKLSSQLYQLSSANAANADSNVSDVVEKLTYGIFIVHGTDKQRFRMSPQRMRTAFELIKQASNNNKELYDQILRFEGIGQMQDKPTE